MRFSTSTRKNRLKEVRKTVPSVKAAIEHVSSKIPRMSINCSERDPLRFDVERKASTGLLIFVKGWLCQHGSGFLCHLDLSDLKEAVVLSHG